MLILAGPQTEEVQKIGKNAQHRTVRRRQHPAGMTYFIMEMARNEHLSAKAIARAVEEKFDEPDCPSARTIQDMVREVRSRPQSGAWQIWDAEPEDAAVVLGVLADLMRTSVGRTTEISQEDAKWIIRLSRAGVGDLPPSFLHGIAIQYQLRGADTRDLDALIAFTPWRSERAFKRYGMAIEPIGIIPDGFPFGLFGSYENLLSRLGFSSKSASLAKTYDDALGLQGEMPWR